MPPQPDNPEGFWEHATIVNFHDRLLCTLARFWDTVTPLPERWWERPEVGPYRQELIDFIHNEFGAQSLWMWKDPRTALFLPLWKQVLQKLDIETHYVLCLRHPLDVAASLKRRDCFSQGKSLALWQYYTVSAVFWTHNARRVVVSYDQLLDDWESSLTRLTTALAIEWPSSVEAQRETLTTFFRRDLRHSHSELAELSTLGAAGEMVACTYSMLLETETAPFKLHSYDFASAIIRAYSAYCAHATLLGEDGLIDVREPGPRPVLEVFWRMQGELSPEQSASVAVHVDRESHIYEISMPLPTEGLLRLDPVNFSAAVTIHSIELGIGHPSSPQWRVLHSWGPEDGFRDLTTGPEVTLLSDRSEGLQLIFSSADPQLFLSNIPTGEHCEDGMSAVLRVAMCIKSVISQDVAETLVRWCERQEQAVGASLQAALGLKDNHIRNLEASIDQMREAQRQEQAVGASLQAALELKDSHIRNLEAGARQKEVLIKDLQRQRHSQEEIIAHHAQHIEKIEEENRDQRALNAKLKIENTSLARHLHVMTKTKEALEQSWPWRLTAPLRMCAAIVLYLWKFIRWPRLHRMCLELGQELVVEDDGFRSTGDDPYFILQSSRGRLPVGWVTMSYRVKSPERWLQPILYFDSGAGFFEHQKLVLRRPLRVSSLASASEDTGDSAASTPAAVDAVLQFLFCLPNPILGLRLDPMVSPGSFSLTEVTIREISILSVLRTILAYHLKPLLWQPGRILRLTQGLLRTTRTEGFKVARRRLLLQEQTDATDYVQWVKLYDTLTANDHSGIRHHIDRLASKPLISIIMPTYNTPEEWLVAAIESVCQQLYPHWELCVADDASTKPHVRTVLEQYQQKDPRIKVVYRERNGHISAASNSALELATGEFVAFLDHDDLLAEHALYMVAAEVNVRPEADLFYSDEDKIDEEGERYHPYFKPDWNPDLFLSQNLVTHLCVCRSRLVREINGFREGYEGAQDWDLVMRIVERVPATHIHHIPYVLYHWRAIPGSTALGGNEKRYITEAQRKTLQSHFERTQEAVEIVRTGELYWRVKYPIPQPAPLVSLIIPTRNGYELLHRAVESIFARTRYANLEVLIIDNQSTDRRTIDYMQRLSQERRVRVLPYNAPFNFSAINNFAVRQARGEVVGFVNNDIEVIAPEWLEEMVGHALRPEIGAVGAMLYYPNETIQHAGVILGLGGVAGHLYTQCPRGHHGQGARAILAQNLSAVTAACLVVRRSVFEEVGGFDEENFAVAFNDVDLCLRIRERGYRTLWTPHAELYHWESASRGYEDTPEKLTRFKKELANMQERWGEALFSDPAYNVNLTLENMDSSLAFPPRRKRPWQNQ